MADRSSRRDVRNPVTALAAVQKLRQVAGKELLIELLLEIRTDALQRADKAWRTHKAPMALYWKAVGVYAGHIARAIR
jgi:hypothetical protein